MWYEEYGITKPFYGDDWVCILRGNCREILPELPDNSVDLVATDPPYNVGKDYGVYKDNLKKADYWALASWLIGETKRLADGNINLVLGSYGVKGMNECKAKHYKTNEVVTHYAFICFGGFGQPPCQYLEQCMRENNIKLRKVKQRKK